MTNQDRINELFRQMVPAEGPADTFGGELVRAACRIGHRFLNDGDIVGLYEGTPEVNAAARFLRDCGIPEIGEAARELWNEGWIGADYPGLVDRLAGAVADYIEGYPGEASLKPRAPIEAFRRGWDGLWWEAMDDGERAESIERFSFDFKW